MKQESMEKRLNALEQQVAQLIEKVAKLSEPKDWRSTIGMFAGDPVMHRIREAGRKIREAEREKARRESTRSRQQSRK